MSADLTAQLEAWAKELKNDRALKTELRALREVHDLLQAGNASDAMETARAYEWDKAMAIVDQFRAQLMRCRAWPLPDNAADPYAALAALETVLDDNNALAFAQSPEGREATT